ncbi:helix-turn-helix transcriptional regulator [uncultured Chitinophaga sp.]|uniref:helix-turn-helix domain-containing protein n=1 Tax=uncultured Chitinophaga sp. TaxID=339340 RepID=UPI00262DD5CA|nr:helix-turn-helix transcriptional regulator [uncultured Chitinophaga sp.]
MPKISAIDIYVIAQVKKRREELKLSQEDLSFRLNKSEGYISQFESHKRGKAFSIRMLNDLAKALDCSPKYFMPDQWFE